MTSRSTYESTVASAPNLRIANNTANAAAHQETINQTIANTGKIMQRGVSVADDRTIRAANVTYQMAKQTEAMNEQIRIQAAKDTLRATGDTGIV